MIFLKRFFGLDKKKSKINIPNELNDLEKFDNSIAICPYCNQTLIKIPSRKSKCKNCFKDIYIIKSGEKYEKKLVTEEQFNINESNVKKEAFKNYWIKSLEKYNVTEQDFYTHKAKHIFSNDNDVFWSIFNQTLFKNASNPSLLSLLYYEMAIFCLQEGKKDNFKLLQLSAKSKLDSFNSNLEFKIEINSSPDSCDNCKKNNNKIISLEEAYLLPIPCKDCTHRIGFCRCYFTPINIRDNNGNLVFKKI